VTQKINGQLEVDSDRGVIYFHANSGKTLLRICGLDWVPKKLTCLFDITRPTNTCYYTTDPKEGRDIFAASRKRGEEVQKICNDTPSASPIHALTLPILIQDQHGATLKVTQTQHQGPVILLVVSPY